MPKASQSPVVGEGQHLDVADPKVHGLLPEPHSWEGRGEKEGVRERKRRREGGGREGGRINKERIWGEKE